MTNVAIWQIIQKLLPPFPAMLFICALRNTSPSPAHPGYPSALGRSLKAAQTRPASHPAATTAATEPQSTTAAEPPVDKYKQAPLYPSSSRLGSLSTMKNSYKLFPELNHLTSRRLVVFNFVTIVAVHSSQSQFFIL